MKRHNLGHHSNLQHREGETQNTHIKTEPRHQISNNVVCEYFMTFKLLTERHFEFLSLIGGCTGSSEFTFVKKKAALLESTCRGSSVCVT